MGSIFLLLYIYNTSIVFDAAKYWACKYIYYSNVQTYISFVFAGYKSPFFT